MRQPHKLPPELAHLTEEQIKRELDERQYIVYREYYFEQLTQEEIGKRHGISRSRASIIYRVMLGTLRRGMGRNWDKAVKQANEALSSGVLPQLDVPVCRDAYPHDIHFEYLGKALAFFEDLARKM